jgi:hypothetical protein
VPSFQTVKLFSSMNFLLLQIPDESKSSQASSLYLTTDGYNENDTVIFNEDASCPGKTLRQGSSEAEAMALVIVRV